MSAPAATTAAVACSVCGRSIITVRDSYVEFRDQETGGFPRIKAIGGVVHGDCSPGEAYRIQLAQLLTDGVHGDIGWATHLEDKRWWTPGVSRLLQRAHSDALTLRGAIPGERP